MLPSIAEWLEEPSAAAAVPDAGLVPRVRDAAPAHDAARSATCEIAWGFDDDVVEVRGAGGTPPEIKSALNFSVDALATFKILPRSGNTA